MNTMNIHIPSLSARYTVRRLNAADTEMIYALCCGNPQFYEHHPPFVTRASILEDMTALPPGKTCDDKYFIGFLDGDTLVAVMDLIAGYPDDTTAHIGFFMMHADFQGKGVGSAIIGDVIAHLRAAGFRKIRLGVDKGNPQSYAFWQKNGFRVASESEFIIMTLEL